MYHEPDTEQHEDPRRIEAELFGQTPPLNNPESAAPLRFELAELLIAITVAAALLARR
jgi:hypothetical protein